MLILTLAALAALAGACGSGSTDAGGSAAGGTAAGGTSAPRAEPRLDPELPENLPDRHRPHPEFRLTLGELRSLTEDLPGDTRGLILSRPQAFLELVAEVLSQPAELLWLVDKERSLPADYVPEDLVELKRYADRLTLNREELSLRAVVMPDLLAMVESAAQVGIDLDLSSTYRSYRYQVWLFDYWVEQLGRERAERSSARPGASEHQLGTAIDFGSITGPFADHPAGRWLATHAWRFGFSLSYPRGYEEVTGYIYEPWHFRYLSRPGTRMERYYFGGVQQFLLEFWQQHGDWFRARYEPRRERFVPDNEAS